MTQNIYDDPEFFQGYSQMNRSIGGLDAAPEWPALRHCCPPCTVARGGSGLRLWLVQPLGQRTRRAQCAGAGRLGENAAAGTRHHFGGKHPLRTRRPEQLDLPACSFDLAYSSLALHYIKDLPGLFAHLYTALKPGSHFVFSIEHPISWHRAIPAG